MYEFSHGSDHLDPHIPPSGMAEIAWLLLATSRGCADSGGHTDRQPATIRRKLMGLNAERAAVSCEHRDAGFLTRVRAMLRSGAVERGGPRRLWRHERETVLVGSAGTRWTKPGRRRYEYRSFPPPAQPSG
jgi:hypothetical protein